MKTLTADDRRRVMLPDAKPGQVFAYEADPDGSFRLVPVKAERQERPFDPHLYDDLRDEEVSLASAMAKVEIQEEKR